jgi:hypothetical protein
MHKQPDLFRPMCAEVHGHQRSLFDNSGPADSNLHCEVCGSELAHTSSGYLACPRGHGKLVAHVRKSTQHPISRSPRHPAPGLPPGESP